MLSFKTMIHFCLVALVAAQQRNAPVVDVQNGSTKIPFGPIAIGGWIVGGFIAMLAYHCYTKKQEKLAAAQKARDEELAEKDKQVTSVIQQLSREIQELKSISQATLKQLSQVDLEAAADAAVNGEPATKL